MSRKQPQEQDGVARHGPEHRRVLRLVSVAVGGPEDMERLEELLRREAGGEEGARIIGGVMEGVGGAG